VDVEGRILTVALPYSRVRKPIKQLSQCTLAASGTCCSADNSLRVSAVLGNGACAELPDKDIAPSGAHRNPARVSVRFCQRRADEGWRGWVIRPTQVNCCKPRYQDKPSCCQAWTKRCGWPGCRRSWRLALLEHGSHRGQRQGLRHSCCLIGTGKPVFLPASGRSAAKQTVGSAGIGWRTKQITDR